MAILGRENTGQSEDAKPNAKPSNGSDEGAAAGTTAVEDVAIRAANVRAQARLKDPEPAPSDNANKATQSQQAKVFQSQRANALQLAAVRKSLVFTQIVSLLMRSPRHKHYALTDLEWLVLPPLERGQLKIAEAKTQPDGPTVPAGFLLWASVSPEIDKRLSQTPNAPMRLRPDEWKSGDILWLIETIGDPRVLKELLKHFRDSIPSGGDVKLRTGSRDGKVAITTLGALQLDEEASLPAQ
jgi:hemolysin-activating ACP:hemolysin acyltransferase